MQGIYRCECNRVLCEIEDETLLVKRKGMLVIAPLSPTLPPYIRCEQCHTWHKLNNSRIMEPITNEEAQKSVGPRCIQCGALLNGPDGSIMDVCPKCGQPQTLTNPILKETRK